MHKAIIGKSCGKNRPVFLQAGRFGTYYWPAAYDDTGGKPGDSLGESNLDFENGSNREFAFTVEKKSRTADINRRTLAPVRRTAFTISKGHADRKALRARPQAV